MLPIFIALSSLYADLLPTSSRLIVQGGSANFSFDTDSKNTGINARKAAKVARLWRNDESRQQERSLTRYEKDNVLARCHKDWHDRAVPLREMEVGIRTLLARFVAVLSEPAYLGLVRIVSLGSITMWCAPNGPASRKLDSSPSANTRPSKTAAPFPTCA